MRGPSKGLTASEIGKAKKGSHSSDGSLDSCSQQDTNVQADQDSAILPLSDPVVGQFFRHYATNITPMMVWLDSDTNEYRRLILPLAENHLILRLAVCAISSANMPQEPNYGLQFSSATCEAAITKITAQVRHMTSRADDDSVLDENDRSVEGTLASMLILANQSLFASDSSRAISHRQAARILLDTLSLKRSPTDELLIFLKNQLALCGVLACTTLFSSAHIETAILPELGRGAVIHGHFLNIVHGITSRSIRSTCDEVILEDLENSFELARGWSLLAAGRMMGPQSRSQSFQEDFIRLIQIFHHAGILYTCKRLQLVADQTEEYHVSKLLKALQQFHDINNMIHNLAWPVFIAGICDCRSPQRRTIISDVFRIMSTNTPFRHYARILTFLQELWETPDQDWILLAKEWEERGEPVVAV